MRRSKCARKPVWAPLAHRVTNPSYGAATGALQLKAGFSNPAFLLPGPKDKKAPLEGAAATRSRPAWGFFRYCSMLPQQLAQLDEGQRRHHRIVESIMSTALG